MSPRQWTFLAIRAYALWLLFSVVREVPMAMITMLGAFSEYVRPGESYTATITLGLRLLLNGAVPILLLTRTDWFADRAFGSILARYRTEDATADDKGEFEIELTQFGRRDLLAMASALVGLALLINVSSEALTLAIWELVGGYSAEWFFGIVLPSGIPPRRLSVGVSLVLGILLYTRGSYVADLWRYVKDIHLTLPRRYGVDTD